MARDLILKVNLQALDNATKPLRGLMVTSDRLGRQFNDTKKQLKGLQEQQADVKALRTQREAVRSTSEKLAEAQEKLRGLKQELKSTTTPTVQFQKQFLKASERVKALTDRHNEQRSALQKTVSKFKQAGVSTTNLGEHEKRLADGIKAANTQLDAQRSKLQKLSRQQAKLDRERKGYERTQQLAGSMAGAGAGGLASGGGILYAGAKLMAPGLDFDASQSKVQALTRLRKDSPEMQALREQARQLGASTQFTAVDASNAQGFLGMAGFDPKAIQAAMPGMLDLAKAGDSGLAETADIASNILTGFNLQASETGRLGDVLVGTFTRSNTNLQMLGETMKYAAPVAASVGQNIETVAAMAGKLGDAGIQGSMGGTALRAILNRLSAPPKAAAKALDKLGVSAIDAQGNLRDMPTVLQEIYEKTKNMGDAERAGLLKHIAGEEAVAGMQVLVKQAGTGALQEFVSTLKRTQGEASATAKTMADNLRGDLDGLGSAWDDLGIQLQEQQNGPMREITQTLTGIVGGVKGWIAENPKLASNLVKTAAGVGILMAGMGGLTLALASILGPFAMVRYGMMLFGIQGGGMATTLFNLGKRALPLVATGLRLVTAAAVANPVLALVTGVALAAGLIYANWARVGPYFLGLWAEIKEGFSGGLSGIAATILNFSPLGLFYRAFAGTLSYLGVDLPAKFTDFGGMLMQGLVNGIKSMGGAVKGAVVGAADSSIDWFKEKLGIHSPSRVFAELGGFTMQGLANGLAGGEDGPLKQMTGIAKRLTAAGAIAVGIGAGTPAMAATDLPAIDNRPPLAARTAAAPQAPGSNTYTIHIHAAPGQDANAIARAVAAELDRREREKGARARSSLFDQE